MNYNKIISLFHFKSEECELFDYISDYTVKITNWLTSNTLTEDQLIRYMLVGFFLEYRASNHQGSSFNTIEKPVEDCLKAQKETNELVFDLAKDLNIEINVDEIDVDNSIITEDFLKKQKRYKLFNKFYGKPVESTEEYLNIMNVDIQADDVGELFFEYVTGC